MRWFVLWIGLLAAGTVDAQGTRERVLRLATLEWPPYNSVALPQGGVNTALVRRAFAATGYRLEVKTMPWLRAVASGLQDSAYAGYFPEYLSPSTSAHCTLSVRTGSSQVVLVKRKASPFQVKNLDDLEHYRVGVVNGYDNSVQFDANVHSGKQPVDYTDSDEGNIQKLENGRVDLIVIDRNVLQWLLQRSRKVAGSPIALEVLSPPLQEQGLYLCFKPDAYGRELALAFARGMATLNEPAFTRSYLSQTLRPVSAPMGSATNP